MAGSALRVKEVSKAYGETRALARVSLDVEAGSIHALLGGNGSGKSTLVKILAGVVRPDEGQLEVAGVVREAAEQTPGDASASGLRFVHQQDSTFPDMTVAENLALGRGFETGAGGRIRWPSVRDRTRHVLNRFSLDVDPGQDLRELGPAQQMMVAIARALQDQENVEEGLLVLDEPTASLPKQEVELLLQALQRYAANGQSILYVTHRLEEVCQVADRATVLRDGQVTRTIERDELEHDFLAELIVGDVVPNVRREGVSATQANKAILEVDRVGTSRGFQVCAGEVVGLAGLLGSGRTSVLRTLFGSGSEYCQGVRIDGAPVKIRSVNDAMAAGVAYIPEDRSADAAFKDLSVSRNLSISALPRHTRWGRVSSRAERSAAREAIGQFGIKAASEDAEFGSLSGGNQQKVVLARWLQRKPRLLLLDEPTQGVDVGARAEIHALIRGAVRDGAGAISVSSDLEELALTCDRVLVMRAGELVGELAGDELSEEALDAAVYSSTPPVPS